MLRQQYAERPTADTPAPPDRLTLPRWNVALRHIVTVVLERTLGERLAPTPRAGLSILLAVAALLVIIAVTLSVGNAALVLLAVVIMRVGCERGGPRRSTGH
jgi:hypothetical protein